MRVSKFISLVSFITCFCLFYVYQQTEIFRLAYSGQKRQTQADSLLEKNSLLRYNIKSSTSLAYIGDKVSQSPDFQMPDSFRLVRLIPSGESELAKQPRLKKETIISRLFGIKRQAEAKTINP